MGDFNMAYIFTKQYEGGYANIQGDRGGETKYGITTRTLNAAVSKGILDSSIKSVKDLTSEDAKTIYKKMFWDKIGGDKLPRDLSIALFDAAVHSGVPISVQMLQEILNVTPDGIIGPETLQAINNYKGNLIVDYLTARAQRYADIVIDKPDQEKFLAGWLNRINGLNDYINKDQNGTITPLNTNAQQAPGGHTEQIVPKDNAKKVDITRLDLLDPVSQQKFLKKYPNMIRPLNSKNNIGGFLSGETLRRDGNHVLRIKPDGSQRGYFISE